MVAGAQPAEVVEHPVPLGPRVPCQDGAPLLAGQHARAPAVDVADAPPDREVAGPRHAHRDDPGVHADRRDRESAECRGPIGPAGGGRHRTGTRRRAREHGRRDQHDDQQPAHAPHRSTPPSAPPDEPPPPALGGYARAGVRESIFDQCGRSLRAADRAGQRDPRGGVLVERGRRQGAPVEPTPRHVQRIAISLLTAGGLVVGGFVAAAPTDRARHLPSTYDAQARERADVRPSGGRTPTATARPAPHTDHRGRRRRPRARRPVDQERLSRSGEAAAAPDRTTPRSAPPASPGSRRSARSASRGSPAYPCEQRRAVPESVYAMAGGCYRLGRQPLTFQATGLGSLPPLRPRPHLPRRVAADGASLRPSRHRSRTGPWRGRAGGRFTFTLADGRSCGGRTAASPPRPPAPFALRRTTGCTAFPEVDTNVQRPPVRRRLLLPGGPRLRRPARPRPDPRVPRRPACICSPPFHRYGAPAALVDCPDHQLADGRGAALEDVLADKTPGTGHDPVGWPTFSYWPNPHSLTHQQVYYRGSSALARRPAHPHQPSHREPRPLHGLPAQEELVRRPRLRAPPGQGDARDAGLHRRAVRRSRPRLVPHRHQPLRRRGGHQPRQARRGDGHGDVACRWGATSSSGDPPAPRRRCSPSSPR